ncbi:efflux RND transporter permease subunit [Neptunicella sp. SCSIO 80796]|uniref:efflux RND transporter permease subunit n=1 Tax=Neptunicella plasticusilytica TaxID=3117012 RepID=UPI003A4E52E2
MLKQLIIQSVKHRALVLLGTLMLVLAGVHAVRQINVDAIPDLSDVQVIVKTPYAGQSPELVEQQITYPLSSLLMAVPGAKTVRGYSFFGDSYIYVIFEEGTDIYWARSRVLEYLSQSRQQLPDGVEPTLGPDASGVGWVYQYALKDETGSHSLADLKSLQDWFLKQELQSVAGVAEVATVGGMTRTYQIEIDPLKLARYQLDIEQVRQAVTANNAETGGSVVELAETEFMVRARGYLQSVDDFAHIPLGVRNQANIPLMLKDIASIRLGPQMRRGIAELDGRGEVVGGIVVMRSGENARNVIEKVKNKLEQLKTGLPQGVQIVPVYDRADFIQRSVDNLLDKLLDEMFLVALVLALFLLHLRSTLVALLILPLSLLFSVVLMNLFGITANIMSLGGIAIAIGALVDAAIVMVENVHKHLEEFTENTGRQPDINEHWQLVIDASRQVGPSLFWSLIIITVSFFPVFVLEGQEGKLFSPLALTKSFAMAGSALFAVTLIPVLMGFWVKGKIIPEHRNPLSRLLVWLYLPVLNLALKWPKITILTALLMLASAYYPARHSGQEFMPQIDEGTLLYMPTTLPGISVGKAAQLLQQTDRLIKSVPEVKSVFGKVGRAETATDPAPLTMLETTIQLQPKSQWRAGMTLDKLTAELQQKVHFPGLSNAWVQPIKTRIDMLSTGIKTPLGIKISGDDIRQIEAIASQVETILKSLPGTRSVFAQRTASGRYIDIQPDMQALGEYGLNVEQLHNLVRFAIGGAQIDQLISGNERYPVNLRFPRHYRDSLEALQDLPVTTPSGLYVPLSQLASISFQQGPAMLKSENARRVGWIFIDIQDVSVGEYLQQAQTLLKQQLVLPERYSLDWSGQYESMQRVSAKLQQIVPVTLMLCFMLLYITLGSWQQSLVVMLTLPVGLSGSLWMLWYLGINMSVATAVGMIALAGVAAEFGVVMYLYLNQSWQDELDKSPATLIQAVRNGAARRVRPKAMTVLTILISLIPVMLSQGTGHEVMQPIAAPLIGGMLLAPFASLFIIPVLFMWLEKRKLVI